MTNTTFIAGMRGVGKSQLLCTYKSQAITIEAEAIQAKAVKLYKGEDYSAPYSWDVWDETMKKNAPDLVRAALKLEYPTLELDGKPLLIVGAMLVKDWFLQLFIERLKNDFSVQINDLKFYVLHLDNQVIADQIKRRGRPHESCYIDNLAKIQNERDGYWGLASSKWEKLTSHEALHAALSIRLVPPSWKP